MPVRLFNLRNVIEDEADDVRQLLAGNEIAFYETYAGAWGISSPAIWLRDDGQLEQARALIKAYQHERVAMARMTYEQLSRDGGHPTLMRNIRRHPLQCILLVLLGLFILYVSLSPFLHFGS